MKPAMQIRLYDLSEEQRFAIGKQAIARDICIEYEMPSYELTPKHLLELQILAAHANPYNLAAYADYLGLNEKTSTRLVYESIKAAGFYSASYPITNPRRVAFLARKVLADPRATHKSALGSPYRAHPVHNDMVTRHFAARMPMPDLLHNLAIVPGSSHPRDLPNHESDVAEFRCVSIQSEPLDVVEATLRTYSARYPQRLDPRAVAIAWDTVRARETGLDLIQIAMRVIERTGDLPATSLEVLALGTALPLHTCTKISKEARAEIYSVLAEVQTKLDQPLFEGITLDPKLLADKRLVQLRKFLLSLRDLFMIAGDQSNLVAMRAKTLALLEGKVVSGADLDALTERCEKDVLAIIREKFQADDSLTMAQIRDLQERWGAISNLTTLVARYSGNQEWAKLVPTVGRILSTSAAGAFADFKFGGFAGDYGDISAAARQLGMLSPEQRAAWTKARCVVEIDNGGDDATDPRLGVLERVRTELRTNLLAHVPAAGERVADAQSALASSGDPRPVIEQLMTNLGPEGARDALAKALERASQSELPESLEQIRRGLTLMQLVLRAHPAAFGSETERGQIAEDITSLMVASKPSSVERKGAVIIGTVLLSDARSLLEVGDLVRAASCQNYRTGSHIDTLPGYVIDANVQAVVSFGLDERYFETRAQMDAVASALAAGTVVSSFAPDQRRFEFVLADGRTVTTLPIDYAYHRQMLKLGTTDDGAPGLALERAYAQTHAGSDAMARAARKLAQDVAHDIGAVTSKPITVSASRGPCGIYSDAAGGKQTGTYRITSTGL